MAETLTKVDEFLIRESIYVIVHKKALDEAYEEYGAMFENFEKFQEYYEETTDSEFDNELIDELILATLKKFSGLSKREIAIKMKISKNKNNNILKSLEKQELIKLKSKISEDNIFVLTTKGEKELYRIIEERERG